MIRILHMIGSLNIGGSQAFILNIYRKIDRTQIQFDFVVDHEDQLYYKDEIQKMGGKIMFVPRFNGFNIVEVMKAWDMLFKEHPEYKVLHSHIRSYASIYLPVAKHHGVVTIIHSHSTSNGKGIEAFIKNCLQFPLRFQADYYMACSHQAGKWLFGEKICKSNRFMIIPNAINSSLFKFDEVERKRLRKQLNLEGKFVVGFLARVSEEKNPLFVVDIFRELISKRNDAYLLFVGDGKLLQEVENKARKYNISNYICFTGSRNDVASLMMAMDCYLLPSLWEGLGISLIEAQATGLICFCSDNIQDEAIVTDLVTKLPINNGPNCWVDSIMSKQFPYIREDKSVQICNSGFDITRNVEYISKFYTMLYNDIKSRY